MLASLLEASAHPWESCGAEVALKLSQTGPVTGWVCPGEGVT